MKKLFLLSMFAASLTYADMAAYESQERLYVQHVERCYNLQKYLKDKIDLLGKMLVSEITNTYYTSNTASKRVDFDGNIRFNKDLQKYAHAHVKACEEVREEVRHDMIIFKRAISEKTKCKAYLDAEFEKLTDAEKATVTPVDDYAGDGAQLINSPITEEKAYWEKHDIYNFVDADNDGLDDNSVAQKNKNAPKKKKTKGQIARENKKIKKEQKRRAKEAWKERQRR